MASVREGFSQGARAYLQDVVIQGRPGTFDPQAIVAPVLVHHGEADTMTPVAHSRHTTELIPGARLTVWPHEGHISLITKIPDIATELGAIARGFSIERDRDRALETGRCDGPLS